MFKSGLVYQLYNLFFELFVMAVECTEDELLEIVENILALDTAMRFAAILDLNGKILEGIMKESKTSLESQKQQEKFCMDAAKARKMREKYEKTCENM